MIESALYALFVLFSIGFRYRLSKRLDACVKDKPCSSNCSHKYKSVSGC